MTLSAAHGLTVMHVAGKEDNTGPARHHLFHDETKALFFRRLAWSPDGDCPLYLLLRSYSTLWQLGGQIADRCDCALSRGEALLPDTSCTSV